MITNEERKKRIESSSKLIGKAVFNSILITLVSFSPILFLTGQEHKLFAPLVWTKTFAMIGSALVMIFLVPVLMTIFLKGKVRPESKHPISRFFIWVYSPIIRWCLKWKKTTNNKLAFKKSSLSSSATEAKQNPEKIIPTRKYMNISNIISISLQRTI